MFTDFHTAEERIASVTKLPLGTFPTPLHRLPRLERLLALPKGQQVWIKRDDLTGVGPGGNKIRCMEYMLAEAKAQGADVIVVSGPCQSNLCTLTACSAAKLGLRCIMVCNAEKPEHSSGNILLDRIMGTEAHFVGKVKPPVRTAYVDQLCERLKAEGHRPYVVRNGASTGMGAMGYVDAIRELVQQCSSTGAEIRELFAPGGNGGVAAGLLYGNALYGNPFRINVISVEDPKDFLDGCIREIIRELETIVGTPFIDGGDDAYRIVADYAGEGWGMNTPESKQIVLDFPRLEGIFIENVYCSKVVVGMCDYLRRGLVDGNACYLHTGGFGSLFAQMETVV